MKRFKLDDIERAWHRVMAVSRPREHFRFDREQALAEDRRLGRGCLVVNPESVVIPAGAHGAVVDRGGTEYRILVDPNLQGARSRSGDVVHGYWIEPSVFALGITVRLPTAMP